MVTSTKKLMGWGWIVFWLIIFWPLGLFFLFRRVTGDRTATLKNAKTVATISYILLGLGVIYLLASIDDSSFILMALAMIAGGVLLNRYSRKMKATGERYKQYIAQIINHGNTSLNNISSATGHPYPVVDADLRKMIDLGYFQGAFIDASSGEIRLVKPAAPAPEQTPQFAAAGTPEMPTVPQQIKAFMCKSCGANNTSAQNGVCEYCGSPA